MADLPIKIGILGLGRSGWEMQSQELKGLKSKFRVVAVCDLVEDRLTRAADELGCSTYRQMGDMFADPDVEIVCIATRSCDRFAHTSAALRAGKDVFVEKPLCTNYDDAKALCELADSLGRHLYVRHNRRFEPAFTHIREIIDSGILGDVFTIKLRRLSYARRDDWQTLKEFGGGQLLNWGPHIIDHALRLLGSPVKSIWSNLKCIAAVGDAEDHVKIVFEGEKGRIVDLEISGGVALGESVYMVWGTRGALSSDEQTIRLRYLNPDVTLSQREANRQTPGTGVYSSADVLDWVEETIPVSPSKPVDLASIWDALWSTVREGAPFPITNDEALQVMQVVSEVKRGSDFENYEGAGE